MKALGKSGFSPEKNRYASIQSALLVNALSASHSGAALDTFLAKSHSRKIWLPYPKTRAEYSGKVNRTNIHVPRADNVGGLTFVCAVVKARQGY
jgi:hypothetical protein